MDTTRNILDTQGYFWWRDEKIPDGQFAPPNPITGHLTISSDGTAQLELDGILPAPGHQIERLFANNSTRRISRPIQGIIKSNGQHVLLVDAIRSGGSLSTNRFSYERYFSTMCLVGKREFPRTIDLPRFSEFEIDLTGFEGWLRHGTLEVSRTRRTLSIKTRAVRDIVYNTVAGKLTLRQNTELPDSVPVHLFELHAREFVTLSLKPKSAITSDAVRSEFSVLQDLMIVLTDSHYPLEWPTVRVARTEKRYTLYFSRSTSSASPPEPHGLPTNFPQLQETFGDLFSAWRSKREKFGAGFHSYVGTRRGIELYVENRFINLVQGLESFHRTKYSDQPVSSALQEKVKRIVEQIKLSKDRRWLEDALRHAREPRLEHRLLDLLSALPHDLESDRLRKFSTDCAHLRNDLAHFGGQRIREQSSDVLVEIDAKSDALSLFYHMTLLSEIGIDDQSLRQWLHEAFGSITRKAALVEVDLMLGNARQPKSHGRAVRHNT
ncbi:HEPN domain-containing protein [Burkholderia aenigmatica]|uniref:ApeA N-terminal domain 1-containing protein n=1 Tax=Burkholderia aenigmatica TaxID=2015348 RepID=UPI001178C844|nr:HEPN domain-containing protein [Burkholderia aenigmatica]